MLVERLKAPRLLLDGKVVSVAAAALGQVLMLAAMALVTRAYPKDALSAYGLLFSVFAVLQIGVTLRLEQGIVYGDDEQRFRDLHQTILRLIGPSCAVLGLAAYVYFSVSPATRDAPAALALAVALATAGSAGARTQILALARAEQNGLVALANFLRPALIALFQVLVLATALRSGTALALTLALAQIALFVAVSIRGRGHLPRLTGALTRAGAARAVRDNRAFIQFSLPQNVVFTISEGLFALSVTFLFPGGESVALFWLASRTVFAPATILAESVRPMIYRALARSGAQLKAMLGRYALAFLAIGLIPLLVLLFFGEFLFALVFGPGWAHANTYALILSALVAFNMMGLPFIGVLPVLNAQRGMLFAEIAGLGARAAMLFGIAWPDPVAALAAATFAYMAVIAGFFAWIWCRAGRYVHA